MSEVDILCVSDGAPVGLRYAAAPAGRVRKLAFWGGFARGSEFVPPDAAARLVSLIRSDWALARTNMATSVGSTFQLAGNALRQNAAALRDAMSQETAARYIEAIAAADATADVPNVTVPAPCAPPS